MMTEIIKLHQEQPTSDIPATLRRIADDIEAGKIWDNPVTTCVVLLGHTGPERCVEGVMHEKSSWATFGFGPRHDTFTVRGLLASAMRRWGG